MHINPVNALLELCVALSTYGYVSEGYIPFSAYSEGAKLEIHTYTPEQKDSVRRAICRDFEL